MPAFRDTFCCLIAARQQANPPDHEAMYHPWRTAQKTMCKGFSSSGVLGDSSKGMHWQRITRQFQCSTLGQKVRPWTHNLVFPKEANHNWKHQPVMLLPLEIKSVAFQPGGCITMTPGRKSWCPARARCQVSTRVLNRGWTFLNGGYQLEKSSINGDFLKWWYPKWIVYKGKSMKIPLTWMMTVGTPVSGNPQMEDILLPCLSTGKQPNWSLSPP